MTDCVHIDTSDDGLHVRAAAYILWLPRGKPYALLADREGVPWGELFLAASVHTVGALDDTLRLAPARVEPLEGGQRVVVDADSTAWAAKRIMFDCLPQMLRLSVRVEGQGLVTDVHLLGGYYSGDPDHGSGFFPSGADFRSVFNPEPWGSERRVLPAGESTALDVLGGPVPGREHWFFTPPPLCLAASRAPAPASADDLPPGPWLVLGLGAPAGTQHFTAAHYDATEAAFSLRLTYEGQTRVDGRFAAPDVRFSFDAPDPYAGVASYAEALRADGLVPPVAGAARPAWWTRPLFCGWGAQCVLAATNGGHPRDYATQRHYDAFLAALDGRGLDPGTVVLDDKWQQAYGTCVADREKWPDLRGWIAGQHRLGRRVLLWWKAWDREGLPPEQCVRNRAGTALGADPSNPAYEASLRASVRRMLGPDGYDADGFKVDFTARTPSGPGLHRHGDDWGMELLHRLLAILYDEAKRTKPDALVVTHTPNPHFADVTDMIRLNDVNTRAPVVPQMTHRAQVVGAACPGVLVDTDNWPMADPETFREYVQVQPRLGVPALYYASHLDRLPPWTKERTHVAWEHYLELRREAGQPLRHDIGTSEQMRAEDYTLVREAWQRADEEA